MSSRVAYPAVLVNADVRGAVQDEGDCDPRCADECPNGWAGDGICDDACNVEECDFVSCSASSRAVSLLMQRMVAGRRGLCAALCGRLPQRLAWRQLL